MMKNPIGWVEIPVLDLERAEKWYETYFGFAFDRQKPVNNVIMSFFPFDMTSYGTAAALILAENYTPSHFGSLIYFTSPEKTVEKGLEKAKNLGITVLLGKTDIGENGFYAILEDSEGNRIAIHSMEG